MSISKNLPKDLSRVTQAVTQVAQNVRNMNVGGHTVKMDSQLPTDKPVQELWGRFYKDR